MFTGACNLSLSCQIDPVLASTSHFKIHYNIILPSKPRSSKWSLSLRFLHHPSPYMPHAPPISFFSICIRTIFDKEYGSLSSSLCSFPNSPVTSSLLGTHKICYEQQSFIHAATLHFSNLNHFLDCSIILISLNARNEASTAKDIFWEQRCKKLINTCFPKIAKSAY